MQRHEALQNLSRDHHHGLVEARHLSRIDTGEATRTPAESIEGFTSFWQRPGGGQDHFIEEETQLLPVYGLYGDPHHELIVRSLVEHVRIRTGILKLKSMLDDGELTEAYDARTVRQLGDLLHDHIRLEERELFPLVEEVLPAAALDDLVAHLDRD